MYNWYVIFVRQIYEKRINDYFLKKGIDSFIPQKNMIFTRNKRKFMVEKPLFPNYIFIRSELDQQTFSVLIDGMKKEKQGIIRLLTYDKEGTSVLNESEQNFIERLLGQSRVIEPSLGYIENDRVIITEGPLQGFESQIVAVNKHKHYATLSIDLFAAPIKVTLPLSIIKKI